MPTKKHPKKRHLFTKHAFGRGPFLLQHHQYDRIRFRGRHTVLPAGARKARAVGMPACRTGQSYVDQLGDIMNQLWIGAKIVPAPCT